MGLTLFKKSSVLVHSSVIPKQKQSKQSLLLLALALKVPTGQMPSGFWRITTASCPGCPQPVKLRHYEKATKYEKNLPPVEIFSNCCGLLRKAEL